MEYKPFACPDCGHEFTYGTLGEKAKRLYWHLRKEHGQSNDEAYEAAGQVLEECKAQADEWFRNLT